MHSPFLFFIFVMRTLFFAVLILGIFRTPLNSSRILSMSCCLFILFFSGGRGRGGFEGWGAKNFALFVHSPRREIRCFPLLGSSRGILVVFEAGAQMCTFGVLGLSCASPGGPVWWGRQGFTRQPESAERERRRRGEKKRKTREKRAEKEKERKRARRQTESKKDKKSGKRLRCRFKTPPCVPGKRPHVQHMRAFSRTHGGVLNAHTEAF